MLFRSDYRNFYNFEIHMQDVVSQRTTRWETRRGTGSGAEQQVPIYVAIGASLASVYGTTQRRPGHLSGMAIAIELYGILGDEGSGGAVCRHFNDLDSILEFDTSDDFRQLICSVQPPPSF